MAVSAWFAAANGRPFDTGGISVPEAQVFMRSAAPSDYPLPAMGTRWLNGGWDGTQYNPTPGAVPQFSIEGGDVLSGRERETAVTHEIAHIFDLLDDNRRNGSPGFQRPATWAEAQAEAPSAAYSENLPYLWSGDPGFTGGDAPVTDANRSEWYAGSAARFGRLR